MKIKPLTYWTVVATLLSSMAIFGVRSFFPNNVVLVYMVCLHLYLMELCIEAPKEWIVEKRLLLF